MNLKFSVIFVMAVTLASIHFAKISKNFVKPSYQVTVTHADGTEHHNIVSLKPEQTKKMETILKLVKNEIKNNGLTKKDTRALGALLSSE